MSSKHLATYLNDHAAGALAAIELMKHLEEEYAGQEIASFVADIRSAVEPDERELRSIIKRLDLGGGHVRRAAAWVTERAAQLKLFADDPGGGPLRLLESLEFLSLGIEGKLALWQSLTAVAPDIPALQSVDFARLADRARDQRRRVEEQRIKAARVALLLDEPQQVSSSKV
jgi:hypothetical protein